MATSRNTLSIVTMVVANIPPRVKIRNPKAYLLGLPVELRFKILGYLLPDVDFVPFRFSVNEKERLETCLIQALSPSGGSLQLPPPPPVLIPLPPPPPILNPPSSYFIPRVDYYTRAIQLGVRETRTLRKNGDVCWVSILRTCKQLYEECMKLIFTSTRTFEAVLNFDRLHDGPPSISFLSHTRLEYMCLPRRFNHEQPAELSEQTKKSRSEVIQLFDRIKSLRITLPMYYAHSHSCSMANFKCMIEGLVDVLVETKSDGEHSNPQILEIDLRLSSEWTDRGIIDNKRFITLAEARLKWALMPFAKVDASRLKSLTWLVDGKSATGHLIHVDFLIANKDIGITDDQVVSKMRSLTKYLTNLCQPSSPQAESSKPVKTLPVCLEPIVNALRVRGDIDSLHSTLADRRKGRSFSLQPRPSMLPPPPLPLDSWKGYSTMDIRIWVWDAWQTEDLEKIQEALDDTRGVWQDLKNDFELLLFEVEGIWRFDESEASENQSRMSSFKWPQTGKGKQNDI